MYQPRLFFIFLSTKFFGMIHILASQPRNIRVPWNHYSCAKKSTDFLFPSAFLLLCNTVNIHKAWYQFLYPFIITCPHSPRKIKILSSVHPPELDKCDSVSYRWKEARRKFWLVANLLFHFHINIKYLTDLTSPTTFTTDKGPFQNELLCI